MHWPSVVLAGLTVAVAAVACSGGSTSSQLTAAPLAGAGGAGMASAGNDDAGATSGAEGGSGGLPGNSGGRSPIGGRGESEAGKGGSQSSAGGAGASGSGGSGGELPGGEAGQAGAGQPTIDACDVPTGSTLTADCTGLCGKPRGLGCDSCNDQGVVTGGDVYFAIAADTDTPGCLCSWEAYHWPVKAGLCVRITVQPGATAPLLQARNGCSGAVNNCIVVTGMSEGAATERYIHVGRPNVDAWFHYEPAELVGGECPLDCP